MFVFGVCTSVVTCFEATCSETLTKRLSIFKADENHTDPYRDVTFDIPDHECFVDESITLDENETLSIAIPTRNTEITFIVFAVPSMLPEFPLVIFNAFPKLTDVHIIHAGIEVLVEQDFLNATDLRRLRLEQNNIEIISKTALAKPIELEVLTLPGNRIRKIEDFAFAMLDRMYKLELQQNNLTYLREHIFSGADELREIHLNSNQIETIEDGVFYLKKLETIFLHDNHLVTLSPDLLTGTKSLRSIDVSGNQLQTIRSLFDKCENLTTVGANRNQIDSIDLNELASIPSLKFLSLSDNLVQFVEAERKNKTKKMLPNTQLEYLNLESNDLFSSEILDQLSIFYQLKILILDSNEFKIINNLNDVRSIFPKLIEVHLSNNSLSCQWLDELKPGVDEQDAIVRTNDAEADDANRFLVKRKQIDGVACTVDEEPAAAPIADQDEPEETSTTTDAST